MDETTLKPPRHEARDIGPKPLAVAAAGIASVLTAMALLIVWLFPGAVHHQAFPAGLPLMAEPHLQTDPPAEMKAFQAEEARRLDSYGWVDRASGTVHIPIEAAMRRVAQDGIPGWPAP